MRVFITGATGLVGNNCLRQLGADHELQVLVRQGYDSRPFADLKVSFHFGDLLEPDGIAEVIPETDVIIHAAGDTHIGKAPRPSQRVVNTLATRAIAREARERGIRFVFVSSVDALPAATTDGPIHEESAGPPKCSIGYVQTKREAEDDLWKQIELGLDGVIVNPGFMLGPWDWKPSSGRMLLEVATRFTPFAPSGGFSVCDVRDVAAAINRIATSSTPSRRYILAGHNMTYFDAWKVFASVSGARPPIGKAGPVALSAAGWWGDCLARVTSREGDVNSGAIRMSKLFHYYDSSRAHRELDYQIRPMETSSADAWAWFREYGYTGKTT